MGFVKIGVSQDSSNSQSLIELCKERYLCKYWREKGGGGGNSSKWDL